MFHREEVLKTKDERDTADQAKILPYFVLINDDPNLGKNSDIDVGGKNISCE